METSAKLGAAGHWDGVHLWLDWVDPARRPAGPVDLMLADAGGGRPAPAHVHRVACLDHGLALRAPFLSTRVLWRPAGGEDDGWRHARPMAVNAQEAAVFIYHGPDSGLPRRGFILGGICRGHAVAWTVERSAGDRVECLPLNPSPRHVLLAPGDCEIHAPGMHLHNEAPARRPYLEREDGGFEIVVSSMAPAGPITVSFTPPPPPRQP